MKQIPELTNTLYLLQPPHPILNIQLRFQLHIPQSHLSILSLSTIQRARLHNNLPLEGLSTHLLIKIRSTILTKIDRDCLAALMFLCELLEMVGAGGYVERGVRDDEVGGEGAAG